MENQDKSKEELISELALAKATAEKYKQIVENASSIILLMDTKGNITFFNQFAQRFFGFPEKEILGRNVIGTIVFRNDLTGKDLVTMIQDIVENPERHSTNENENIRSNGELVRILWTNKAIIDDEGKIKQILCVGNQIKKKA